jgi:hypothetical protein
LRFDYVWNAGDTPEVVLRALAALGDQPLRVQWTGGAGGSIERDVHPWTKLERWKLHSFDKRELEAMGAWLSAALGTIALELVDLLVETVYQDGLGWVGWLFWHRKEIEP